MKDLSLILVAVGCLMGLSLMKSILITLIDAPPFMEQFIYSTQLLFERVHNRVSGYLAFLFGFCLIGWPMLAVEGKAPFSPMSILHVVIFSVGITYSFVLFLDFVEYYAAPRVWAAFERIYTLTQQWMHDHQDTAMKILKYRDRIAIGAMIYSLASLLFMFISLNRGMGIVTSSFLLLGGFIPNITALFVVSAARPAPDVTNNLVEVLPE